MPEGGALIEVTCRTIQGRFLLRPSQQLNDILLGVLGRAQDRYPLEIVAVTFLSSHMHLLLRVPDAQRLSEFMGYFNGNLAREVGRLTGWFAAVWARRYDARPRGGTHWSLQEAAGGQEAASRRETAAG